MTDFCLRSPFVIFSRAWREETLRWSLVGLGGTWVGWGVFTLVAFAADGPSPVCRGPISSSMGSPGGLPPAATAPLPRAQGGGGSPGGPVASASPPLRSAPLPVLDGLPAAAAAAAVGGGGGAAEGAEGRKAAGDPPQGDPGAELSDWERGSLGRPSCSIFPPLPSSPLPFLRLPSPSPSLPFRFCFCFSPLLPPFSPLPFLSLTRPFPPKGRGNVEVQVLRK